MGFGVGEYGQRGYGGSSFETDGPALTSTDPLDLATGVDPSDPVSFTIESPAGLDINTLDVDLDGLQCIVGGEFLPGYGGTITQEPETAIAVVVSTHPSFPGGATPIDIDIIDLAALTGPLSFSFTVDDIVLAAETLTLSEGLTSLYATSQTVPETLTLSEGLVVSHGQFESVAEAMSIVEDLEVLSIFVEATDGETLVVYTPFGLRIDNTGYLSNFSLVPADDVGVPVALLSHTVDFDVIATGSTARVEIDEDDPEFTSDIISFPVGTPFAESDIGNYIEIQNGPVRGTYRITEVLNVGWTVEQGLTLRVPVRIERRISYIFQENGFLQEVLEYVGPGGGGGFGTSSVQYRSIGATVENGLQEILFFKILSGVGIVGGFGDILDHNTFEISFLVNGVTPGSEDAAFARLLIGSRVQWRHISAVTRFTFKTSKFTGGADYLFSLKNLYTKLARAPYSLINEPFTVDEGVVQKPRISGATLNDEGVVFIEYDQPMQVDTDNLLSTDDYEILGPTIVNILAIYMHNPATVALVTSGLAAGDYTLTVSTATPTDFAGNPLDPVWNQAVFTAAAPLIPRSVFTDKGPISKPPLTVLSGINAVLETFTEVTLPGASLTSDHVGLYLTLSGGSINGGTFRVSGVISSTKARLQASFTLPDPDSGSLTWELFDPQNGMLADDPADVTVRINGTPVTPEAVVGLLGQIVLNAAPGPTDDVKIDYSWCCNPTVDFRRLNSREFRLNAWNRDLGYPADASQHKYRFNNVLVRPADYKPLDSRATLDQPLLRELHYRAYERAYTPVLNDPTLLLLNSPIHRIAYPPAQRTVSEEFITYEATGLPENQIVNPWDRVGLGTASIASGFLTILDDSSGDYPTGQPLFWTRDIDLTFPHVFAMSWRFKLDTVSDYDGIFSGVVGGYSDDQVAVIIGFLEDSGVKKIGIIKKGYGDDPAEVEAWTGGLDTEGSPTGLPIELDWSVIHSLRLLRDLDGTVKIFIDGDIDESLRVTSSELPALVELAAPFDTLQGVFFGSVSRPARSSSDWDFVRYLVQPTNPLQTSPSSFVSYEANVAPESDASPWTPVGFHGTSTILSTDFLLLDSTSASDVDVGLVGGDYRGYLRFEPLLSLASEFVVDAALQLQTLTHGISPDGLMFAIDDGTRLMQVAFFTDLEAPKISYGGRSMPEDFSPFAWTSLGGATVEMAGRILRITDTSLVDGKVYSYDDTQPSVSSTRVVASGIDYISEFRCQVVSYTVDGSDFAGVFGHVFDGTRSVGVMLQEDTGTRYVAFHSDGVYLGTRFAFDWGDDEFHTYRLSKSTSGDLVSLFVDGTFLGSLAYSSFTAPAPATTGQISFGSATPASSGSLSVVEWAYCNTWRLLSSPKRYVGLWKGADSDTLLGYHLPLKVSGRAATVAGNALGDGNADFVAAGVVTGDTIIVDSGPNRGVFEIASVVDGQNITTASAWPSQPSLVDYRIIKETDWSSQHKYRLARDSTGTVSLFFDTDADPLIQVDYGPLSLPVSGLGIVRKMANNLPAIVFGSFDIENLAQSRWDYVRYGITRSPTELRIAPHHQFINQWNVMHSPERLFTQLAHTLTDFKSSSTGIVPKEDPDFLADADLEAFTQLNEGTPLVPSTQSFEVRSPYSVQETVAGLNRPEDVLNTDPDFVLNDGSLRFRLIVPDDVLYSSLDVIEQTDGEESLITPFGEGCSPNISGLSYTDEVCLTYTGDTLPEDDTAAPTEWNLLSDNPAEVSTTIFGGVLTYGTGSGGTKTAYRNDTPLPDSPGLRTEARFRMKVLADSTLGTADSQIRIGMSAPGLTVALGFVTTPLAERFVLVLDLNNGNIVGSATFDFLDGNFHTYRLVRDPGAGVVQVFIDS